MADLRLVAVTGSTGFVGRYVVRELLSRGYGVRALVRNRHKAKEVLGEAENLTTVVGDALDLDSVAQLVAGCGACVNLVGIIRQGGSQTFQKMHVDVVQGLVDACKAASCGRFVHVSALRADADGVCAYQKTKYAGERAVRLSGLDWTVFRPGLVHGEGGEFIGMVRNWVRGKDCPGPFIPYFRRGKPAGTVPLSATLYEDPMVAPVAVEDVARAIGSALSVPESIGEVYNLVGSQVMSWPEMLRLIRDMTPGSDDGLEPVGMPGDMCAMAAKVAGRIGLGTLLPFDEGQALMACEDSTACMAKVQAHLGLSMSGFAESYAAYAGSR